MIQTIPKQLIHKEVIKCIPKGKYLGNYMCHVNSLSYALRNPTKVESIVGVVQVFSSGDCCAHFIVKLKDGTYIDPTYGNMSGTLDSYHIPIETYSIQSFSPNRELQNLKDYIKQLQPWYKRWLCSY